MKKRKLKQKYHPAEIEEPIKDEGRICSKCAHAHKVEGSDYDKTYECDAEEFDIETLSCFVPKDEQESEEDEVKE